MRYDAVVTLALPQISRADAALWSTVARAVAAKRPVTLAVVAASVGEPLLSAELHLMPWVSDATMWTTVTLLDAHGALAEVAIATTWLRRITQRLLGGPDEMAAPRPATAAEHAVWAFVASAIVAAVAAPVEVSLVPPPASGARSAVRIALQTNAGLVACAVVPCRADAELRLCSGAADGAAGGEIASAAGRAVASATGLLRLGAMAPPWWSAVMLALPLAIATTSLPVATWHAVRLRDVIVVASLVPGAGVCVGQGLVPLRWDGRGSTSRVDSSYVAPAMIAVPDDTIVTLTVTAGALSMSLARLASLTVGEILELGVPSHGAVELRMAGAVVALGELVDVAGELGVRVTRLGPA